MGLSNYVYCNLRRWLGLYSLGVSVSTSVFTGMHMYMHVHVGWIGSEALPRRWPAREVCIVHMMNAGPKPYSEELSPLGRRPWIANSTDVM